MRTSTFALLVVALFATAAVVRVNADPMATNGTDAMKEPNIKAMRHNLKPTIAGLKRPKSIATILRRALRDVPDELVEPLVNLFAAADQVKVKQERGLVDGLLDGLTDGILNQIGDLLDGLDDGLIERLVKVVQNVLKALNLSSNRPKPPASKGCNILYLQLRGILLQAIDLDLDNVCL